VKVKNESFHSAQQRVPYLQREDDLVKVPASKSESIREAEDLRQYTVGNKIVAMRFCTPSLARLSTPCSQLDSKSAVYFCNNSTVARAR